MTTLQRSSRNVQVSHWKKSRPLTILVVHSYLILVFQMRSGNIFKQRRTPTYISRQSSKISPLHYMAAIRLQIAYFQPLFHGNFLVNTSQVDQISFFQIILGWKLSNQCTGQGSQLNSLTQQSKIMRVCTFATLPILDGTTTKGV